MRVKRPLSDKFNLWLAFLVLIVSPTLVVGLGGLAAACGGTENTTTAASATPKTEAVTTTTPAPTTTELVTTTAPAVTPTAPATTATTVALVPMSAAQIAQWNKDATAAARRFCESVPKDVETMFADFSDDAAFYDPCSAAIFKGKQTIVDMQRDMNEYWGPEGRIDLTAVYVSADSSAFTGLMNTWPPFYPAPADHPDWVNLEIFHFKDGRVGSWDTWNGAKSLELATYGVFAPGQSGPQQLQQIADRYLSAWGSGDTNRIAALYHPDAVFTDTILGLTAQGGAAIGELGEERFGTTKPVTFEIIDLYAQTYGYKPPAAFSQSGAIIGVGIHYKCNLLVDGKPSTVESLTTFELGTRQGGGWNYLNYDLDPDGLIHREEVFYRADSLLASGLVQ
jgi:ketosteroid isomerase-like protein